MQIFVGDIDISPQNQGSNRKEKRENDVQINYYPRGAVFSSKINTHLLRQS